MQDKLMFPNKGTWVKKGNGSDCGVVEEIRCDEEYVQVHVRWLKNKETEWIEPEELSNGFMIGMHVQDMHQDTILMKHATSLRSQKSICMRS